MAQLSKLFGESPFSGLQEHSRKVHECVRLVSDLFQALEAGSKEQLESIAAKIVETETAADKIQNRIHESLASKILMPVNKNSVFNILEQQDTMADRAEDIAATLTYRDMKLPAPLMQEIKAYLERILQNCDLAEGIISKIPILVESSFSGRDALTVSKLVTELNEREDETKSHQIVLTRKLLSTPGIDPVEAVLWYQVIGLIADLSRYADHTASGIRRILEIS